MTAKQFIEKIEEAWEKELPAAQPSIWLRRLGRFDEAQLDKLFDEVMVSVRYFPRTLEPIWTVARESGLFNDDDRKARTTGIHLWEPTSCKLCGGDGRLIVYMAVLYETDDTGRRERRQLRRIFRASDGSAIQDYAAQPEELAFLFRCSCSAGDAETLPEGWPKWQGSVKSKSEEVPF